MTTHDFVLTLLANLIGTFAGAGTAILATWWFNSRATGAARIRHLQGLIDRIHRSRALAPNRARGDTPLDDSEQIDFARCGQSVLDTRTRIAAASDDLWASPSLLPILDDMYVDCLQYLEASAQSPTRYVELLGDLRSSLRAGISQLCDTEPKLQYREPGMAHLKRLRTQPDS